MRKLQKDGLTVYVASNPDDAALVIEKCKTAVKLGQRVALDFETTALRPDESDDARVRLTSLSFSEKSAYIIDHDKAGRFEYFVNDLVALHSLFVFNNKFEGRWIAHYYQGDVTDLSPLVLDVGHMQRAVMGGGPLWLKTMVKKAFKVELDKEEQNSNWGARVLTAKQYFYAGSDAIWTFKLAQYWADEMSEDHWKGFRVINDAWRAVNECEDTGMLIDVEHHSRLIKMWERRRQAAEKSFRKFIPTSLIANIRSKKQFSDLMKKILDDEAVASWPKTAKTGQLQSSRDILRSMSYISPYPLSRALAALMVFNRADKYLGTYGETLLTIQNLSYDGLIHSRLNMAQAVTGRFSSSSPNQQNYPRQPLFRYSFVAFRGCKLIIADYSGIEIRVLAELSGDKILLHDAIYDDVHARSAIAIYQIKDVKAFLARLKAKDPGAKEMRSRAKAFTFQLLYGAGPAALAIALRCTFEEAVDAINKWAERYSKAYHYRQYMFEKMRSTGFLPCGSGRTIFVHRNDRTMPVAANYPIQGTAADVMYRAMYHVQNELDRAGISAALQASVHDEVLVMASEEHAGTALECLERGMKQGWLDIFPDSNTDNLAEAAIGDRWSDKS